MIAKMVRYLGMSTLHAIRFLPGVIIFAHFVWGLIGLDAAAGIFLVVSEIALALICVSFLTFWLFEISIVLFIAADLALMWGLAIFVAKVLVQASLSLYYFNVFAYWVLLYSLGLGIMLAMRKFFGLSKAM
ncbi:MULTISPECIES: hypothetical protein [unclassified Thalassospira]|uniref:hypothetical protein n=1 Tax=unclassified Thalassospira TaxID=2648997 RepID=UPI000A053557|nr:MULTISPECIES: hypothetical protein [unclassified Thalassospira]